MVLGFFKKKEKKEEKMIPPPAPAGKELEIPPAPPSEEELPEFPEIPEFKEEEKPKKPVFTLPEIKPEKPVIPEAKELEEEAFKEEKEELTKTELHEELIKPFFVKMEAFQSVLSELNLIKNVVKESDDAIARVWDFAENQEKEFNKWQAQLSDIQKKLIFVDKTMFKE